MCLALAELGFKGYTGKQCQVKVSNLKAKYKEVRAKGGQTGQGRIAWGFFEAMDEVLGGSAQVDPVSYADTLGDEDKENEDDERVKAEGGRPHPPKQRGKKRKSDPLKGVLTFLENSELKWQELERKRIESEERQTAEKNRLMELLIKRITRGSPARPSYHSPYPTPPTYRDYTYRTGGRPSHRPSSPRLSPRPSSVPSEQDDLIDLLGKYLRLGWDARF